jgi:TolA-binding protein
MKKYFDNNPVVKQNKNNKGKLYYYANGKQVRSTRITIDKKETQIRKLQIEIEELEDKLEDQIKYQQECKEKLKEMKRW